jgi:hypothetical protein
LNSLQQIDVKFNVTTNEIQRSRATRSQKVFKQKDSENKMIDLVHQQAISLMSPPFDSHSRALLYLMGKREDLIVKTLLDVLRTEDSSRRIKSEHRLMPQELTRWNQSLKTRGYFDDSSGLKARKKTGRVDLSCLDPNAVPETLIEVKAWSATDAVDDSRYTETKQYNHSLLKSFEIDALKLLAVNSGEKTKRLIVTALFTVHCDNLSVAQMKRMGLPFVGLLNKQNIDKAGIGNSDAYRIAGLHQIINQFQSNFGEGTELNAEFINVSAFGREDAFLDGVGLSLDLIGATLK